MVGAEEIIKKISVLEGEAEKTDAELSRTGKAAVAAYARGRVASVEKKVGDFLAQVTPLLLKVAKISRGQLVVSGGRIGAPGSVPERFGADDAEAVAEKQKQTIVAVLRRISQTGVTPSVALSLGKALSTLYALSDGADAFYDAYFREEKQRAAELRASLEKRKKQLSDELGGLKKELDAQRGALESAERRFRFDGMSVAADYAAPVSLPVCAAEAGGMLIPRKWRLSDDGPLVVRLEDGEIADGVDFLRALIVQFLYAYPALDKQILYCSEEANRDMDNFLFALERSAEKGIFFDGMRQIEDDGARGFEYRVSEVLMSLRKKIQSRANLLNGAGMRDICEYNAKNPMSVQPPVLVVLQHYPFGYENCSNIRYLFENGGKTGVFFVVVQKGKTLRRNIYSDEEMTDPALFADKVCSVFQGGRFAMNGENCIPLSLPEEKIRALLAPFAETVKKKNSRKLLYEDIGFGREDKAPDDDGNTISIPVGIIDNEVYSLEFAVAGDEKDKPISYLLLGAPKMGKSSLIESMIYNGGMKYSPDDLQFYLIDFKDGVSAGQFRPGGKGAIPHVRILAENSRLEEAEIILQMLENERARRNKAFSAAGYRDLVTYNREYAKKHAGAEYFPRIVIIIDEIQKLFQDESNGVRGRSEKLAAMCEDIARMGRSAGIHLVFASQSVDRAMSTRLCKFVPGRFCFSVSPADAENVINPRDARTIQVECDRPGVALVSHNEGVTCRKVRIAYHDNREEVYSAAIRNKWRDYPVDVKVVGVTDPLTIREAAEKYAVFGADDCEIPVGEDFFFQQPVRLPFDRYHHSMLVVGKDERVQTDLFISLLIGALRCGGEVRLLDASGSGRVEEYFGGHPDVKCFSPKQYGELLQEAHGEFKRREEDRRASYRPYFVAIRSLSTVRDFVANSPIGGGGVSDGAGDMPEGYVDPRSLFLSADSGLRGADTLYDMLKAVGQVPDFYLIVTAESGYIFDRTYADVERTDYKIFHEPYDDSLGRIAGAGYNSRLAESCRPAGGGEKRGEKENVILLSRDGTFTKMRYFQYEDTEETFGYIHSLGGKRR